MKRIEIHPVNPQPRLIRQVAEQFQTGALVALPTDASYVLACHLEDRTAVDRMRQLRGIDEKHLLTLLCRDLSELSQYAQVDNRQFRFLKEWTPGAYTFILPATREVPRRLMHPSRKTVGLRVPEAPIVQALLAELGVTARAVPPAERIPAPERLAWACFAGVAPWEVVVDDPTTGVARKLVGFAQRRSRHGVLLALGVLVQPAPWRAPWMRGRGRKPPRPWTRRRPKR